MDVRQHFMGNHKSAYSIREHLYERWLTHMEAWEKAWEGSMASQPEEREKTVCLEADVGVQPHSISVLLLHKKWPET